LWRRPRRRKEEEEEEEEEVCEGMNWIYLA
jgi:hypothetical protein